MLRLIGTPLSHFTRKIRILLSELGVDHVFDRARSVLATDPAAFGNAVHYQSAPGLDRYPKIAARVARFAGRTSVASTAPVAALAEAAAAGWTPG